VSGGLLRPLQSRSARRVRGPRGRRRRRRRAAGAPRGGGARRPPERSKQSGLLLAGAPGLLIARVSNTRLTSVNRQVAKRPYVH
jgi:hypothetical protein